MSVTPRLVIVWAVPRSGSTMVERALQQSPDVVVVHEPFTHDYYYGASRSSRRYGEPDAPPSLGADQLARAMHAASEAGRTHVVVKELAFQGEPYITDDALRRALNLFLVRAPERVLASLLPLKPDFSDDEFGFVPIGRLATRLRRLRVEPALIVDGDAIRADPSDGIERICSATGIRYDRRMLAWKPGPVRQWRRDEADCQAKWHATLESSSRILAPSTEPPPPVPDTHAGAVAAARRVLTALSVAA